MFAFKRGKPPSSWSHSAAAPFLQLSLPTALPGSPGHTAHPGVHLGLHIQNACLQVQQRSRADEDAEGDEAEFSDDDAEAAFRAARAGDYRDNDLALAASFAGQGPAMVCPVWSWWWWWSWRWCWCWC